MGTVAVPSPKTLFPAMGLVAPCQAEPSPASPHALVMKGSRHSVPDPAVGRGRAQESRADSSDKELLFLRRGLGNIPDCLFVPGVSLYRRRWAESRAAAPHGHPGVRGGETPPPPPALSCMAPGEHHARAELQARWGIRAPALSCGSCGLLEEACAHPPQLLLVTLLNFHFNMKTAGFMVPLTVLFTQSCTQSLLKTALLTAAATRCLTGTERVGGEVTPAPGSGHQRSSRLAHSHPGSSW